MASSSQGVIQYELHFSSFVRNLAPFHTNSALLPSVRFDRDLLHDPQELSHVRSRRQTIQATPLQDAKGDLAARRCCSQRFNGCCSASLSGLALLSTASAVTARARLRCRAAECVTAAFFGGAAGLRCFGSLQPTTRRKRTGRSERIAPRTGRSDANRT